MKPEDKAKLKRFFPFLIADIIITVLSFILASLTIINKIYLINGIFIIIFITVSFGFGTILKSDGIIIKKKCGQWIKNCFVGFMISGYIFFVFLLVELFVPNFLIQVHKWSTISSEYVHFEWMAFVSALTVYGIGALFICLGKIFQVKIILRKKKSGSLKQKKS